MRPVTESITQEEPARCFLCGNVRLLELQPSTLEEGRLVCRDLDACYLRLIKDRTDHVSGERFAS